jgi:hypothetical protein
MMGGVGMYASLSLLASAVVDWAALMACWRWYSYSVLSARVHYVVTVFTCVPGWGRVGLSLKNCREWLSEYAI